MHLPSDGCLTSIVELFLLNPGATYIRSYSEKENKFKNDLTHQLLSWLLADKDMGLLGDNHLPRVTSELSKGKLDAKEKAFFKYLFGLPLWG